LDCNSYAFNEIVVISIGDVSASQFPQQ
jgi:hypothetical protein